MACFKKHEIIREVIEVWAHSCLTRGCKSTTWPTIPLQQSESNKLDEPLLNLDAQLGLKMRVEIGALQQRLIGHQCFSAR